MLGDYFNINNYIVYDRNTVTLQILQIPFVEYQYEVFGKLMQICTRHNA